MWIISILSKISLSLPLSSGFAVASTPTEEDPQSGDQPTERVSSLVKTEIEKHIQGKETVEKALPHSVDIGPFHINTDTVRLALAKKHKDIVRSLLDFLVLQLRKESEQVLYYNQLCINIHIHVHVCILYVYTMHVQD